MKLIPTSGGVVMNVKSDSDFPFHGTWKEHIVSVHN